MTTEKINKQKQRERGNSSKVSRERPSLAVKGQDTVTNDLENKISRSNHRELSKQLWSSKKITHQKLKYSE